MNIKDVQKNVSKFASERAWDIITPSQRVAHLQRELGKLSEYVLFHEGVTTKDPGMEKMPKQLGDVLFSLSALANSLNVDLAEQLNTAMKLDAVKYPAEETKIASLRSYSSKARPVMETVMDNVSRMVNENSLHLAA